MPPFVQVCAGPAPLPHEVREMEAPWALGRDRMSANLTAQGELKAGDEEMLPQHSRVRAELALQGGAENTGVSHWRDSRLPNPNVQSGATGQEHQHKAAGPGAQAHGYFLSQRICGTCRLWGCVGKPPWLCLRPCLPPSSSLGGVEGRHGGRAGISLITQPKNSSWP